VDPDDGIPADPDAGKDGNLAAHPNILLEDDRSGSVLAMGARAGSEARHLIANLAGSEDTVGPDLDGTRRDQGAPVEPRVATDPDARPGVGGDQPVGFRMGPGIDLVVQPHLPWPGDPQAAVAEQALPERNPATRQAIGKGGDPTESGGQPAPPVHAASFSAVRRSLVVTDTQNSVM
jgi:hypothetical protein